MKDLETLPKLYIRGLIAPKDGFSELFGGGESFSASDASKFLEDHAADPEIVVEISSDGGYKTEGVQIFNILRSSGKKITTISYKANSIATVIMLSGQTRLIVEFSQFVVHFARIDPTDLGMDPLTAEDFQKLAEETERSDKQIVDIYCSVLGEEKRMELMAAMADESDLGAKGAIKLGFATGYYKKAKAEKVTQDDFKGVLIGDHLAQIIQNNMAEDKNKGQLEKLEALMVSGFGKLAKAFSKIKNEITLPIQGGGSVYVVPADPAAPDNLMGAKVYTVDASGLPTETPAPDGNITLDDGTGRILVVAAGVVSEVQDPAAAANKMAAENTALQAANAELQAKLTAMETQMLADKTAAQSEVTAIQNAFSEYKKLIPGDGPRTEDKADDITKMDFTKMTTAQKVRAMSKERARIENERKELSNK
jgi:ATP-dependent protease ClpP protease subunit